MGGQGTHTAATRNQLQMSLVGKHWWKPDPNGDELSWAHQSQHCRDHKHPRLCEVQVTCSHPAPPPTGRCGVWECGPLAGRHCLTQMSSHEPRTTISIVPLVQEQHHLWIDWQHRRNGLYKIGTGEHLVVCRKCAMSYMLDSSQRSHRRHTAPPPTPN